MEAARMPAPIPAVGGLSPQDVTARVEEIGGLSDPEEAHSAEDDLYREVLEAIANWKPEQGTLHYRDLCREALKTQAMSFPRWVA